MSAKGKCDVCGKNYKGLPYTCRECGGKHCSDHRLPEAHSCGSVTYIRDEVRSNDEKGALYSDGVLDLTGYEHSSKRDSTGHSIGNALFYLLVSAVLLAGILVAAGVV